MREQDRIVLKLESMLARIENGEAAARRALDRLMRYRAAVLHAAVTGELTRDWRKSNKPDETGAQLLRRLQAERRAVWEAAELKRLQAAGKPPGDDKWKMRYPEPAEPKLERVSELPKGWAWMSFDQATLNFDGLRVPLNSSDRDRRSGRYPYYGASGIIDDIDDYLFDGDYLLVAEDGANLLSRSTPIAFPASGRFWVNNHAHVVQPVVCPREFLAIYLNAIDLKFFVTGTAQPKLNQANLNRIPVPLPSLQEQATIVKEVERRLASADRLTATLNRQLERAHATRQSLLREAFAGNLVPQDPNDEPASALLNRIRAAREAEAKKPKAKRMPKPKSKPTKRSLLEVLRENKRPMTAESLFRESGYETLRGESDEPQDVVDAFYAELRELTAKPPKIIQQTDSKHQVLLRVLP